MSDELDILQIVAADPSVTQRKIAEQTGISLGQVNFLIKKFIKKGYIKIEGQTPKSIRYNLTPRGFSEKASLTLEYIRISYGVVIRLTDKIRSLAAQYKDDCKIVVCGPNDEMMEICKIALCSNRVRYINSIESSTDILTDEVIFFWHNEDKNKIGEAGIKAVNILA